MRDRVRLRDRLLDLAAALVGRRDAAANVEHAVDDRLRSTLASIFGFEDVPPDSYIEQAARHHVARIATLERHWMSCARMLRDRSAENVKLAFEADDLRRRAGQLEVRLADALNRVNEREHQIDVVREYMRNGDVQGAEHYLWTVTRADSAISAVEVGGLQHPGTLGGEEVGDVG